MAFFRVIGGREDTGNTAVEIAADVSTNALKVFQVNNPTLTVTPQTALEIEDTQLLGSGVELPAAANATNSTAFMVTDYQEVDRNEFLTWEITIPNQTTEWFFLSFAIAAQYECKIDLFEDADAITGTSKTVFSRNRVDAANATTAATFEFLNQGSDPVVNGTIIFSDAIGADKKHGGENQVGQLTDPLVLADDTVYLLRIESEEKDNLISSHFRLTEVTV